MKLLKRIFALTILIALSHVAKGSPRFWVSAISSNWNNTANWSATSGGAGGASVPGTNDDVTFDNTNIGNCTINMPISVTSITVAGYSGIISQGANTIVISSAASFGSGTFAGGSANITVMGVFSISGAIFTATSSTLELQNNAAFTAGSFSPNAGTVRFKTS